MIQGTEYLRNTQTLIRKLYLEIIKKFQNKCSILYVGLISILWNNFANELQEI